MRNRNSIQRKNGVQICETWWNWNKKQKKKYETSWQIESNSSKCDKANKQKKAKVFFFIFILCALQNTYTTLFDEATFWMNSFGGVTVLLTWADDSAIDCSNLSEWTSEWLNKNREIIVVISSCWFYEKKKFVFRRSGKIEKEKNKEV